MPITPVPEKSSLSDGGDKPLPPSLAWREYFFGVFRALMAWKRTYTATATIDFGNIVAGGELTSNVSVPGARQADAVIVSPKTKVVGLGCDANVSANDVVTVRRFNYSLGAIDPAADDFRVVVIQQ